MTTAVAAAVLRRASGIALAIFDVDGVLTNGQLLLGPQGQEFKQFHARDGQGLVMLRDAGIAVAVISGRASEVVTQRMNELGITHVYQGERSKERAYEMLLGELDLRPEQTCFVGDDLPDIPVMRRAGLAVAVADAHPCVLAVAHWCTTIRGGYGAARETCELILQAQGKLLAHYARFGGAVPAA